MNLNREICPSDVAWITVAGTIWFLAGLGLMTFQGDVGLVVFVAACIAMSAYLLTGGE